MDNKLTTKIAVLEKTIDCIERKDKLRFKLSNRALKLQAREYERRLADLNHEADQLKNIQTKYVPRETYEAHIKEIDFKVESSIKELSTKMEVIKSFKDNMDGKLMIICSLISICIPILVEFIYYLIVK